jgi:hypothetical protein
MHPRAQAEIVLVRLLVLGLRTIPMVGTRSTRVPDLWLVRVAESRHFSGRNLDIKTQRNHPSPQSASSRF